MYQHRNGNWAFGIATVLMILLGLGNGMLGVMLDTFFPALDAQAAAQIAPALFALWLVALLVWLLLLVGLVRRNRPTRRSSRHPRRESSGQSLESTMQSQWKHTDVRRFWPDDSNDTRERIDRTERKPARVHDTITASTQYLDFDKTLDMTPTPESRPSTWSLALLQELEWHRFEEVCAAFLQALGMDAMPLAEGPDSEVSLQIGRPGVAAMQAIAKTRAGAATVDVEHIRALLKVQDGFQLGKAYFLTAGSFSLQALAVGRDAGLVMIDGMTMLDQIQIMPLAQFESLLLLATSGDYRSPTCPACSSKMLLRTGELTSFWRCSTYPACTCRVTASGDSTFFE